MNWSVPTIVSVEKVMAVVFEAPNVAVPVGTVPVDQLAAESKFPDAGIRSQVAFCA